MRDSRKKLGSWAISLVLLSTLTGTSHAIEETDGDWPSGLSFFGEGVVSGNPLDDGDIVYGLRGSHRFSRGDLGIELGVAHSEPTSPFVRSLGPDADLLLVDFSVVWYANYGQWYSTARQHEPWHRNRRIKPEVVVFGGPGWASLRIDDAFPSFPLSDASKDYFTLNGGVGVELRWMRDDPARGWDHRTSRWFLRPEVRGRWFAGDNGDVDWSVGLSLGVNVGKRPTELALRLKADVGCELAEEFLDEEVDSFVTSQNKSMQKADELHERTKYHREGLVELKAHAVSCGPRCRDLVEKFDDHIERLNEALENIRNGVR